MDPGPGAVWTYFDTLEMLIIHLRRWIELLSVPHTHCWFPSTSSPVTSVLGHDQSWQGQSVWSCAEFALAPQSALIFVRQLDRLESIINTGPPNAAPTVFSFENLSMHCLPQLWYRLLWRPTEHLEQPLMVSLVLNQQNIPSDILKVTFHWRQRITASSSVG